MKIKWLVSLGFTFAFFGTTYAQVGIPASNGSSTKPTPCGICVPSGWTLITGTPDISTATIVAGTDTAGGGAKWDKSPLPLPPNNHTSWITIRDVGTKAGEEAIQTTMTGLTVGRDYEVVIYSLTALATTTYSGGRYSPTYIDKFDFQVGTYPRVNVTQISKDIDGKWGTNRLVFKAQSASMPLKFYPGFNASTSSYESVNISVTLNALNTLPVGENFVESGRLKDQPVTIDVASKAVEYDDKQSIQKNTIDLDVNTPGIQSTYTDAKGTWTADVNGFVTFMPSLGFEGQATIEYTIQDNYTLNGVASPGTSLPKTIKINIPPCTTTVKGSDFSVANGGAQTFTMPATDYGFQFDIYTLDNSFMLNINGVNLANEEIDFQPGASTKQNVEFLDGTRHAAYSPIIDVDKQIYNIIGDKEAPTVRVKIAPDGTVKIFARKSKTDRNLYEMRFFGNVKGTSTLVAFNSITWNTNIDNTVIASQKINSTTFMSGYGSGLKKVVCPCTKAPQTGTPTGTTKVGISTNTIVNPNWPSEIPNGALVLDSNTKGMVITRVKNVVTDIKAPIEGMIAYDETDKCVKLYNGDNWDCLNNACDK
ncbi:cadherin-like domain-containing protein [Empedobacter falsenii]|uniref:cadherin-like domain-containing protein n=1 Tax=Empedobacter falsenii TaxID=343874 RepID=UPI00257609CB|nr:cadherin-like domain-containing protein [Empedobacter falsenii]MDM1296914.1 cadherin-like domain-containing protein [Empedobacter falsenii]MDM1316707.1 cadherin-like domain-containing protein [Empedobacter falsenii]